MTGAFIIIEARVVARGRRAVIGGLTLAALVWAANSSWLYGAPAGRPLLLAHRGLAQTFPIAGLSGNEDTSKLIYPPEHACIEAIVFSMKACSGG